MKEKLARWLRTYKLGEVEVDDPTDDGIVPWDKASEETKGYWLKDADQLLLLISGEIEQNCKGYEDNTVGHLLTSKFWQSLKEV